ncbi:hypothetical protein [Sulfitobacter sp.]|uniref:hypothetical protein n=1 Tax=Sulfitobacter sp. TaxID=1903071 RepID=UPI0032982CBB
MSKAVTNEEVEDVLSSIRRLVSEDKRPLAGLRTASAKQDTAPKVEGSDEIVFKDLKAAAPKGDAPAEASDRLVLTSALRVQDTPTEAPENTEDSAPLDLGAVARQTWMEDESDLPDGPEAEADEAPLMLFPQAAEADCARDDEESAAMDAVNALVQDTLENEAAQGAESDYSDESYWNDEDLADSPAGFDIEAQERMRAEEEASIPEDNAPETDEDDTQVEAATPTFVPARELYGDTGNISVLPLTAKIAALEAAVSGTQQEWEPDGSEEEDLVPADAVAMAWEDDVDLDALGAPVLDDVEAVEDIADTPPETEEQSTAPSAAFGAEDQLLDEEALRDLVSEIVRAELQGALGERITRNVRKLVRREIHRALTAQELE